LFTNILEQVAYTRESRDAQANSAFYPSWVGK